MSAKTTSGPSKSRTSAPAKRGRPAGVRAKATKNSSTETESPDVADSQPVVTEKKTRGRRPAAAKAGAETAMPVRRRAKAAEKTAPEVEADSVESAPVRRTRRTKIQADDSTAETALPSRRRTRKADSVAEDLPESAPQDIAEAPTPKRRGRKPKAAPVESTAEENVAPAPKKRGRKPKAAVEGAPAIEEPVAVEPTKPRRGRKPKAAVEAVAADVAPSAPKKRGRKPKAAVEDTPTIEEPVAVEPPKPRRGRKPKAAVEAVAADVAPSAPKKRGRKPKPSPEAAPVAEESPSAAVAKPDLSATPKPPSRRGRPRKNPLPVEVPAEAPVTEVAAIVEVETKTTEAPVAPETSETSADQPRFADLGLAEPIMRAIQELGYEHPTPIQAQAIPEVLKGHDVLGVAQTGTGKTASFTLPMLEKLSGSRARARMPRSLILEPTRELALQVADNFKLYGKYLRLTHALLIGGESMAEQREVLNRGVDVLIATPGRLLDLFGRGGILLTQTSTLVIDEADRMLDMGFIPDIEKIVSLLPRNRQTLFFSATMAPEIRRLADAFLSNPVQITVSRPSSVATTIEEGLIVVEEDEKRRALRKLLRSQDVQSAIVFCNRKRDVDMLQRYLTKHGFAAGHLHGDLAQSLRFSTLDSFKSGELKILVCSDVAARGIDIGGLSHVFNFDLPFNAEDYVHRIGRTGRAGKHGHAFSIAGPRDRRLLEAIETLTGKVIARLEFPEIHSVDWAQEDENGRPIMAPKQALPAQQTAPAESTNEDESEGQRRKRRRGGRKRNRNGRDDATETGVTIIEETSALQPVQDRKSVELAPAFENDAPKTGFGGDTPAFMLVPRRRRMVVSGETDLTLPVQHDARHYGDE
ncbi:DEAD/DEAH box helicase [Gluconobacter thailandicus]|uniref:DEAD/DEAH box helicase n=1 Tax=Gluconobacter thailandicus TaxID=257438 RepID=UPI00277D16C6|nr:DEAD/DEAH box helicase [Gluconobacter thailandicus]